jgi:hypothetical protein
VVLAFATASIGEDNFLSVVVNLRVANAALRIVEQSRGFTGAQVQTIEFSTFTVGFAFGVFGIVAKVGIPMSVVPELGRGKDNLLRSGHWAGKRLVEKALSSRRDRRLWRSRLRCRGANAKTASKNHHDAKTGAHGCAFFRLISE